MRFVRISGKMLLKSFLLFWLFVVLLVNGQTITQEVTRKMCPPMKGVNPPENRVDTSDRVKRLREEMTNVNSVQGPNLNAYIITRYDEHMNDFTADYDKRLEYITGYSGNYGLAIISKNKLAFWTDEVHHYLANNELSCEWTLYKTDNLVAAAIEWLIQELQPSMRIGGDTKLVPNTEWEAIGRAVTTKNLILMPTATNLVDVIWPEDDRPITPNMEAYIWGDKYSGRAWRDKVTSLRTIMKNLDSDAIVITSLSEIAWLLNIRGFDLPYGPFLRAYLLVTKDQIHLYANPDKLKSLKDHLAMESCFNENCVRAHPYNATWIDLKKLSSSWKKVILPSSSHFSPGVSRAIQLVIQVDKRKSIPSPLIHMMSEKNDIERKGMREAQVKDAIIFCNLMARIETELERAPETVDEIRVVNITNELRLSDEFSRSISYPTAVASGPNTGMPLYVPNNFTNIIVERNKLLIIDAGAHYWSGTTASARTILMDTSEISEQHIELYTRLLMGLINLASFTFPSNLYTSQLDIIARTPLWEIGADFPHSSGHGIGIFMNFYESPIDLNYRSMSNDTLKYGCFVLAEVGYYQEDDFGMKLSMILEVVYQNHTSGYLTFEPITLIPFEPKMINYTMLSLQQKLWLNEYNNRVKTLVIDELKRLSLNNGYNWGFDRVEPIPLVQEDTENASSTIKSKIQITIMLLFILQIIFNN